ncbi:hypothetical protein IQ06DRAFT_354390 [Phaeosphaeriaceae sp. SRC1lsM3a]|nr:hypothetical protein IQ06DRAFT_354390 [Stagonospora sp. SRC1lsM3a]
MATCVPDALLSMSMRARLPTLPHEQDAVSAVKQLGRDDVIWLADPGDPEQTAWLIAPSPARALQWILEHGTKKGVMEYVRQTRKRPRPSEHESDQPEASGGDARDAEAGPRRRRESHDVDGPDEEEEESVHGARLPAKRQKTHTGRWAGGNATAQAMRKLEADRLRDYHRFFHNSQEAETDVRETAALCREQHAWLRFVGQQPEAKRAGERQVSDLVCRATTVGNTEAVEDLLLAMQHWRASQRVTNRRPTGPFQGQPAQASCLSSQQTTLSTDMARDCSSDIARAQHSYRRTKGASRSSAFYHIDHRYHAARVREIYDRRCARQADPNADPSLSTQKRGRIQVRLYYDCLSSAEAVESGDAVVGTEVAPTGDREWEEFRRTLKHGKRWLALEKDFTCGIFALLPKSRIPSTFLERKLTDEIFTLWRRMLRNCSPHAVSMAKDAEQVVRMMACDERPPTWRLALEAEEGCLPLSDTPTPTLAALLKREGVTSPRIREISSEPSPSVSPDRRSGENASASLSSEGRAQGRSSKRHASARRCDNPFVDDEAVVPDTDAEDEVEEVPEEEEEEEDMDEYCDAGDEDVFEALGASIA